MYQKTDRTLFLASEQRPLLQFQRIPICYDADRKLPDGTEGLQQTQWGCLVESVNVIRTCIPSTTNHEKCMITRNLKKIIKFGEPSTLKKITPMPHGGSFSTKQLGVLLLLLQAVEKRLIHSRQNRKFLPYYKIISCWKHKQLTSIQTPFHPLHHLFQCCCSRV